jgi:hypothetical protein
MRDGIEMFIFCRARISVAAYNLIFFFFLDKKETKNQENNKG